MERQMNLKIERISTKPIETSKGPATKVGVFSGGKWYSCFAGDWNSGWKEGQTIDVEVKQNGQYLNIVPPKKQYGGDSALLDSMSGQLAQMMKELLEIKALLMVKQTFSEPPPHGDDDVPPELPF
jgi:hypothetical protein